VFATILTSFVIESTKKPQGDPEFSGRESPTSATIPFHSRSSSSSVKFLLYLSLIFIAINVLSFALSDEWINRYLPASSGKTSNDACERHLRVTGARKWHMDRVLAVSSGLLHLALFIFLHGLAFFVRDVSKAIAIMILVLNTFLIILYAIATVMPWFSPTFPFRTPFSTFFPEAKKGIGSSHILLNDF